MNTLDFIKEHKIIAIVRYVGEEHIVDMAKAMYDGGIRLIEITFDQNRADCNVETPKLIKMLCDAMGDKMAIGAGTVMTVEQCELAAKAGATYMIAPNVDVDVIKKTKELGLISMPGALTPTEAVIAYNAGADIVKMFPAGSLGVGYLKAIKAPLSHIPMAAVGGVSAANIKSFLEAGMDGVGVGGSLVDVKAIKAGEFDKIKQAAIELVEGKGEL